MSTSLFSFIIDVFLDPVFLMILSTALLNVILFESTFLCKLCYSSSIVIICCFRSSNKFSRYYYLSSSSVLIFSYLISNCSKIACFFIFSFFLRVVCSLMLSSCPSPIFSLFILRLRLGISFVFTRSTLLCYAFFIA